MTFTNLCLTFLIAGSVLSVVVLGEDRRPPRERWDELAIYAIVESIDREKREVVLLGGAGGRVTMQIPESMDVFKDLRVGESVVGKYYTYLKAEFRMPTTAEQEKPLVVISDAGDTFEDGNAVGSIVKAVVIIDAVQSHSGTVTVKGPRGRYTTLHVRDRQLLNELEPGEVGVLTFAEAVAAEFGKPKTFEFGFTHNEEGWVTGFADYPKGEEKNYELQAGHAPLPKPLDPKDGAIRISGNNHSDDLFMFMKKKISGLQPSTKYELFFDVELATNVPVGMVGVGGSPGSSVYVKAGAKEREPRILLDRQGYYRMNIDKGNQASTGRDMINIGNMENGTGNPVYRLVNHSYPAPFPVTTNEQGELWLIIGTDSGFEAVSTVYYNKVSVAATVAQ